MDFTVKEGETMELCASVVNSSSPSCPIQFNTLISFITEPGTASKSHFTTSNSICMRISHVYIIGNSEDYNTLSLATTIPACADSVCVLFQSIEDHRVERDEMLEVFLLASPGLDSSINVEGEATVFIEDDDSM